MQWQDHSSLRDKHAFLSASSYHWLNYDDDKFDRMFLTRMAAARGTELHEFAKEAIRLGIRLPKTRKTLNLYINDAIGFRMSPEVILYYSPFAFGTVDAIAFRNNLLRISDLKTGVTPASFKQLLIYAAYFCLEYNYKPSDIKIELRIYQNDSVEMMEPEPHEIFVVIDRIINRNKRIIAMTKEEAW